MWLPSFFSLYAQGITSKDLDLAPDTFDDSYVGCSEEMEDVAVPLLQREMAHHTWLRVAWETAEKYWEQKSPGLSLPPGFKTEHGIAIVLYTNSSNTLHQKLNEAVRTGGGSWESYMNQFHFKALHFYLTRALQLLRGGGGCSREPGQAVFRGVGTIHFEPKSVGDSIRLGQFTSSSLDETVARGFGNATFFSLRTCSGAPIQALSVFPEEREVLIPPYEVFVVTNFSKDGNKSLVTLSSSDQMCSHFNCAYLGGEPCVREAGLPGGPQLISVPRAFKRPT